MKCVNVVTVGTTVLHEANLRKTVNSSGLAEDILLCRLVKVYHFQKSKRIGNELLSENKLYVTLSLNRDSSEVPR